MPAFTFDARNGAGQRQQGTQDAPSAADLVHSLRQRGWLVLSVEPASDSSGKTINWGSALNPFAWLPPRSLDVEWSLQQMSVMLRSGLTLLAALKTIAEYAQRPAMRKVWENVAERIQQGSSLADAMAEHRCFSFMVLQMIRVGELTGTLDQVVARAADALERRRLLKTQVLTVLTYPAIVVVAAIGVAIFMIVSVIPKLRVFLEAMGRKLPAMTQNLLDLSAFFQTYGVHILIGIFALTILVTALYLWPPGRLRIDRFLLWTPILGPMLRLGATAQFAHGLSVMLQSGVTLVEGLRTAEKMLGNRYLSGLVVEAREAILRGSSLAVPLAVPGAFMPMLSRMVAVGESAGTLQEVLMEVARFHETQLQSTIRRFSTLIEPAIVVVVGSIVGYVYIAFFVAMFAVAGGAK
jgi:type II secretory pathway component PulF